MITARDCAHVCPFLLFPAEVFKSKDLGAEPAKTPTMPRTTDDQPLTSKSAYKSVSPEHASLQPRVLPPIRTLGICGAMKPERAREEADKRFSSDYTNSTYGTNNWIKDSSFCVKFEWEGRRPPRYRNFALTFGIMDHPTLVDFLLHGTREFMHKFSIITLAVVESELIFVFTTKQAENISLMYRIMQKFNAFGMHIKMCGGIYEEIAVMSGIRGLENELDVNKMECKNCSLSVNDYERLANFYTRAIAPVMHKYPLQPFFNGEYEFERMQYDKSKAKESAKAKSNPQPDGEQAPKRKRGRPRKVVQDVAPVAAKHYAGSGSEDSEVDEAFPEPRAQPRRKAKSDSIRYYESYQNDDSGVEDFDVNAALDDINGSRPGKRGRTDETTGVSLDSFCVFRDLF
jgi:hypothetical protein